MRQWPEFRRPLFVGATLLYGAYQLNRRVLHEPLPPVVTAHLADLAALPVLLTLALAAQRRLGNHSPAFVFPSSWLLAAWAFVSVWFEVLLPLFSSRAVADPLDVVAYALGTLAFRRWLNRPA
jgi:hypothetical protein